MLQEALEDDQKTRGSSNNMEVDDPQMIYISKLEVDILEEEMTN